MTFLVSGSYFELLGVGMAFSVTVALRTKVQEDRIPYSRGHLLFFNESFSFWTRNQLTAIVADWAPFPALDDEHIDQLFKVKDRNFTPHIRLCF